MVLISEIADDGGPKEAEEEEAKEGEVKEEEEVSPEKSEPPAPAGSAAEEVRGAPAGGESSDPTPAAESSDPPVVASGAGAGQTLYNEYALRVAYIMRSYLNIRQAGMPCPAACTTSAQASAAAQAEEASSLSPQGDRCKAMMEVVRKEHGRWTVSKLISEHNHPLEPPAGGGDEGLTAPVVGMEFESVEAAKAFYYGLGEKSGFKPRTGSNRRSAGSGALIMQRFLCWRGNYLIYRKNSEANAGKRKRGPYKKRARLEEEGAAAATAKKHNDAAEVIEVESSSEKGRGVAGNDGGAEVQSDHQANEAVSGETGAWKNPSRPALVGFAAAEVPAAATGKAEAGAVPAANAAQSRLLRELGVRVYRYTEEERRDIILKYLMKRTNRQVVERPVKVPSRQASADRRQRGVGGRFIGRDGLEVPSRQDEMTEAEPDAPTEDHTNAGGEPKVGMVFANEDKAYEFYVRYAGTVGFSVRKGWWDKSGRNVTRSRVYVCSREGFRPKNVTNDAKKPRPETRTGCPARLAIKIMPSGKYSVSEFVADHNHELSAPLDIHMLKSRKLLSKVKPGGHQNASLIPADYKNYLRSKRTKDMQMGDAGTLLEYLQKMKGDNPSFFYAIQLDEDDQLTNIFWADAYSMMDYHHFGDVVCFDTTYKANSYDRPFALFIGVNHHKQAVIFGAALLYDETADSFKWLFETFKAAMSGKQPKTILTDQCAAMSDAISDVWPGTTHRLCVWHIYQNATKNLSQVFQGSETFAKDLGRCMYDCEEEEFQSAWQTMLGKYELKDNEWLGRLYEEREKWALVYGRQTFCADIANTLRNENLSSLLKEYLKSDADLLCFFKQYEKLLEERRYAEKQADYYVDQGTSRLPPLLLLWQAANAYTPAVFEMFRSEFELFMNCIAYSCGEVGTASEYDVTVKDKTKGHFVRFDSADGTIVCSCRRFEFTGIQCCHVLKVLDLRNIKELPPHFLLKRWRKDAKAGSVRENQGLALDGDPISSLPKRYTSLCRMLYKIAARAAENAEAYAFMESQSDQLLEQVERILQARILEKPPLSTTSKGQPQNLVQNESNSGESPRSSGKKKKSGDARRRQQNGNESNKRLKGRQGSSEEAEVAVRGDEPLSTSNDMPAHPRNPNEFFAPSHFVQGTYVPGHHYGLGSVQGFHGMAHFSQMQESSASALQQQQFHGGTELSQACPAPDVHSLQFVGNPQLAHQSSDQGHYNVPVWDFL